MVDIGQEYPIRAFWNGSDFTDGWTILKAIAWQPLPEPYRSEESKSAKNTQQEMEDFWRDK